MDNYQRIMDAIAEIEIKLQSVPAEIPYTKKDGSTYAYLNFSKLNLMNTLKAAVYNMNWHMIDTSKIVFKDHREVTTFIKVLTETGGFYITGIDKDEIVLNRLELPAYQSAAEILINNINKNNPMTLGHKTKPLIITFKECI